MASITIGATKLKIPSDHAQDFSKYLDLTCGNITQTLKKKGYELDVLNKLRPNDFSNAEMLPFRLINDNREISLDRSFELKLNNNNELYAVFNLGAVKLATLSTSASLIDVIKHLTHFNFEEAGNFRNYRAGVDVSGNTLPKKFAYSSSISDDVTKYIESLVKENLRTNIFGTQDITLSITRKVTESLTEKFVSEPFIFPEIKEEVVLQNVESLNKNNDSEVPSTLEKEKVVVQDTTNKLVNENNDLEITSTLEKQEFVVQGTTVLDTPSELVNKVVVEEVVAQNVESLNKNNDSEVLPYTSTNEEVKVKEEVVEKNATALNTTSNLLNKTVVEEFVAQDTKVLSTQFTAANENQEKEEGSKVQTSSFVNSASDNSFNISPMIIFGTVVGAGLGAFMLCARNNHGHGQMVPAGAIAAFHALTNPIMNLVGHHGSGNQGGGLPFHNQGQQNRMDNQYVGYEKILPSNQPQVRFVSSSQSSGFDSPVNNVEHIQVMAAMRLQETPLRGLSSPNTRNELLNTAKKRVQEVNYAKNSFATQETIDAAVQKIADELDNDDNQSWFREHRQDFEDTLKEYLYDNVKDEHTDHIYNKLKGFYRDAIEKEAYDKAFLTDKTKKPCADSTAIRNLKISTESYKKFGTNNLLKDLKQVEANKGYILYLVMFMAIPLTQAVEVESFYGNSTTLEKFDYLENLDNISNKEDDKEVETSEELEELSPILNLVEPKGFWADVMSELGGLASYTAASGMANVLLMQLLTNPYTGPVAGVLSDMDLYLLKLEMAEVYHNGILQFLNTDSDTHHLRGSNSHNDGNE